LLLEHSDLFKPAKPIQSEAFINEEFSDEEDINFGEEND
jgi:hypothetical protein